MIRVLIAGEGSNELGNSTRDASQEGEASSGGGVIEALMAKVRPTGWTIRGRMEWLNVKKLRVNAPGRGDEHNVRVLSLKARELGCNALVFLRDRDGDVARERAIQRALRDLSEVPDLRIAGGVPIEQLECWLLALRGEKQAHLSADPPGELHERHAIPQKETTAMVQLVRNAPLLRAPEDAVSLWRWLRDVAGALWVRIPERWPLARLR